MASDPSARTSASTESRPAVLVVPDGPGAAAARRALTAELGEERAARLERVLLERALRWAEAHGEPWLLGEPDDAAPPGVRMVVPEGRHAGELLGQAFTRVFDERGAPVIVVGTRQPRLGERHAWAVLDDLRSGVDVVLGPANDGGWYLVAAREPHAALFGLEPEAWEGGSLMQQTLEAALAADLSVGWLTSERVLGTAADLAALLADPCSPRDVVAALRA